MSEKVTWQLFSDGGASSRQLAAAACIIEEKVGSEIKRYQVGVFLGDATNNEAEIFGGLIGFLLFGRLAESAKNLHWISDSEYVLKSATSYITNWQKNGWRTADKKPVKNQGLWRAFLHFSKNISFTPEHVRGHTGHPENEACDEAVQMVKNWGENADNLALDAEVVDFDNQAWTFFDGRLALQSLRQDQPEEEDFLLLSGLVDSLELSQAGIDKKNNSDSKRLMENALLYLRQAYSSAKKAGKSDPKAKDLAERIAALGKEFKQG